MNFGSYDLGDIIKIGPGRHDAEIIKVFGRDRYLVKLEKVVRVYDKRLHAPSELQKEFRNNIDYGILEESYYRSGFLRFLSTTYRDSCVYQYKIYFDEREDTHKRNTYRNNLNKMQHFIQSCPHNMVILPLSLRIIAEHNKEDLEVDEYGEPIIPVRSHSNIVIFNKKTGVLFRFDGLGWGSDFDKIIDKPMFLLCSRLRRKGIRAYYKKPLVRDYLQDIRRRYIRKLEDQGIYQEGWMPSGMCMTFAYMYMHYALFYPNLTHTEIYDKISRDPKALNRLIMRYASYISRVNKTGMDRVKVLAELKDLFKTLPMKRRSVRISGRNSGRSQKKVR